MSQFFTTTEAGQTFGACPRTTCKLVDSGQLRGFKLPGSKERRIAAEDLRAFLLKHDIPLIEFELMLASKIGHTEQMTVNRKLRQK